MGIGFNEAGALTVPSSWFAVNELIGGKIRATPEGQVMGVIAEWGSTGRGSLTRGVTLAAGNASLMSDLAQSLVITDDMGEGAEPIAATVLAYAADHYDGPALSNPLNAMILARPYFSQRGIAIAGCVHPEAVRRWGFGEAIGRINTTPWSLEGARYRETGHVRIGSIASPGVLGAAVTAPGFVIERLAAADSAGVDGVEAVTFEQPVSLPQTVSAEPDPVATVAPEPVVINPVDFHALIDNRVQQVLAQRDQAQLAQAEREQRAQLLRTPIG